MRPRVCGIEPVGTSEGPTCVFRRGRLRRAIHVGECVRLLPGVRTHAGSRESEYACVRLCGSEHVCAAHPCVDESYVLPGLNTRPWSEGLRMCALPQAASWGPLSM